MHASALLITLVCASLAAGSARAAELVSWPGPAAAPALALRTAAGTPLSLADLRGKVVLVNFWATWCEPCTAEMPALQALRERFAAQGFEVLAVNYQEGPARIENFVGTHAIRFPIVRDDDGAAARAWSALVFPTSVLIDRAGRRRYAAQGEIDWTSATVVNTIRTLIAEPRPR